MANPKFNTQTGELFCGACGKPMARSGNKFNDSVASCSDPACAENGKLYEEGSGRHNPYLPENRPQRPMMDSTARFVLGFANFKCVDGVISNV